jgi:hypothetical protein
MYFFLLLLLAPVSSTSSASKSPSPATNTSCLLLSFRVIRAGFLMDYLICGLVSDAILRPCDALTRLADLVATGLDDFFEMAFFFCRGMVEKCFVL